LIRWGLICCRRLDISDDADDLVQESLLLLLRHRLRVTEPYGFIASRLRWLTVDRVRRQISRTRREVEWAGARPAHTEPALTPVADLIPEEFRPLAGFLEEGLSFGEIAREQRLTKSAVQRRVKRLRAVLVA
jgi:DNA-directed RNA polymerase specialized sigma24 family protein